MTRGVLYISYSGMLEPLGQSQVLAYQEKLAAGHAVHLISFERTADWQRMDERERVAQRMAAAGIHWHPLRYHKRLSVLATLWDILVGTVTGLRLVRRHRLGIVHARSYIPSVMALFIKRWAGVKFLFDMRGFWADERVDGGLWPRDGRLYRLAKGFERRFLLNADHVVSLTHAAVREMERFDYLQGRMPPITVIPTCADLDRFRPLPRAEASSAVFTLGYVGSAGTWYQFDRVVECFRILRQKRPDARFLVVNRNEHEFIRRSLEAGGVSLGAVELCAATHAEIPMLMSRMDAGVFFIKPVFSKQASAPTKLGEFLGCGIPCLSNQGVGDMAQVLECDGVGIALSDFQPATLELGLDRLLRLVATPGMSDFCVAAARRHFSLAEGVGKYSEIYYELSDYL